MSEMMDGFGAKSTRQKTLAEFYSIGVLWIFQFLIKTTQVKIRQWNDEMKT